MKPRPFQFSGRIRSFKYAFIGIWTMLKSQRNAWIHACATMAVIVAGLGFGVSRSEWLWLILAIMAVWTAEALNTAFEFRPTRPRRNSTRGQILQDVAAGAVLIAALGAVAIGLLVFSPYVCGF
jgi:diacylglycerol kinase (ATP)